MRVSNFMVRFNWNRHMDCSRSSFSATLSSSLGKAPKWNPYLLNLNSPHLGSVITSLHTLREMNQIGNWLLECKIQTVLPTAMGVNSILITTSSQAFFSQFYKHILVLYFLFFVSCGPKQTNKSLLSISLEHVLTS